MKTVFDLAALQREAADLWIDALSVRAVKALPGLKAFAQAPGRGVSPSGLQWFQALCSGGYAGDELRRACRRVPGLTEWLRAAVWANQIDLAEPFGAERVSFWTQALRQGLAPLRQALREHLPASGASWVASIWYPGYPEPLTVAEQVVAPVGAAAPEYELLPEEGLDWWLLRDFLRPYPAQPLTVESFRRRVLLRGQGVYGPCQVIGRPGVALQRRLLRAGSPLSAERVEVPIFHRPRRLVWELWNCCQRATNLLSSVGFDSMAKHIDKELRPAGDPRSFPWRALVAARRFVRFEASGLQGWLPSTLRRRSRQLAGGAAAAHSAAD